MEKATFSYNMYVKEKLIAWRNRYEAEHHATLNYTSIAKEMENRFQITTSPQKIAAMFDSQSTREIKLQEIVALSQMYDIPLWDLCQYPNIPGSCIEPYEVVSKENHAVHELHNHYYFTNEGHYYYCYYFKPKHFQNHLKSVTDSTIEEARMSVSMKNGHTEVRLEEMKSAKTFYGEPMPSFVLTGNLYHFENTNMAYSFISDQSGRRAMALMFSYLNLSADIRYYLTAGMMTFSLNQTHCPLFQKMAVFRVRQDLQDAENTEILRGILSLNSCPMILDEETIQQLKEDDTMRQLLSEGEILQNCRMFNENAIRDSFAVPDDYERMERLLRLRQRSLNHAHEIVSEPDCFADYIKQFQLRQIQKKTK